MPGKARVRFSPAVVFSPHSVRRTSYLVLPLNSPPVSDQTDTPIDHRPLAVLGWAAFLACSWTWCIGMFLPVILLRDYGTFAWVVFALPNVVGAAAMGWVLHRQGASERLVGRHGPAMAAFSGVTILFHVLFVGWVVRWLGSTTGRGEWAFVLAAAGAAVVCFPLLLARRTALLLAALTLAGSLAAFVVTVLNTDRMLVPAVTATVDLAYLAPVCLIGFALSPYLDLTFHRARQALTSYGGVAAFTLGFGAMFLLMIVFTLWYGPMAVPPDAGRPRATALPLTRVAALAVVAHMAGQSGFTVAAHVVELVRQHRRSAAATRRGTLAAVVFGGGILGFSAYLAADGGQGRFWGASLGANEVGYRLFLSFYGLVTPAYVWLFLVPWGGSRPAGRHRWVAFALCLLLAAPAFWAGFIEGKTVWLLAGVGVVLLSRPVLELVAKPQSTQQ